MRGRLAAEAQKARNVASSPVDSLAALAERIRLWRKRHGMTQADLAIRSGISVSFISMIERGERSPSYDTLVQLAQALDIPLSELFRAENEAPTDDGYYRRLVEFARGAHLSRKQVEQLVSVGRAMFDPGEPVKARLEIKTPPSRRCAVQGCGRPILARGLCPSHYRRKLRQSR